MNIFLLDKDPLVNAQYYTDKHVVKMILESVQMLSTAVRLSGVDAGYRATHKNHPCSIWVRESASNFMYLYDLVEALHDEWRFRFNHPDTKEHKSFTVMKSLPLPDQFPSEGPTPPALAMPDQYKSDDPIEAYRAYYCGEKQHLFNWTKRETPYWI